MAARTAVRVCISDWAMGMPRMVIVATGACEILASQCTRSNERASVAGRSAADKGLDVHVAVPAVDDRRRRVQLEQTLAQRRQRCQIGDQVELGQDQAIRHRHLLHRFCVQIEILHAENIDLVLDDPVQRVVRHHLRVLEDHAHDRSGVGQSGGFDQHPAEVRHIAARRSRKP